MLLPKFNYSMTSPAQTFTNNSHKELKPQNIYTMCSVCINTQYFNKVAQPYEQTLFTECIPHLLKQNSQYFSATFSVKRKSTKKNRKRTKNIPHNTISHKRHKKI